MFTIQRISPEGNFVVALASTAYNTHMIERVDRLTVEESQAIHDGFEAVMEYIRTVLYKDQISSHTIAKEVVKLRTEADIALVTQEDNQSKKHLEIAKITSYCIERIWPALHRWSESHPHDFPWIDAQSGHMRPATQSELKTLFGSPPYINAYHIHATIVNSITKRYVRRLDGILETTRGSPQGEARIFMRFRDLMHASDFHRKHYGGDPARQISAGFMTGTLFSWALIGEMERLYQEHTGATIPDVATKKLVTLAAEDFVLKISRIWLDAFNVVNDTLLEKDPSITDRSVYVPILKHVALTRDAERGFVFTVDDAGLTRILQEMKRKKHMGDLLHQDTTHTMCPALIAAPETQGGEQRKSAIVQLFRWCAAQADMHALRR